MISAPTAAPVEAQLSDLEIELAAPEDVGDALELESRPDLEGTDDLEDTPTQYVVDSMGQFLGGVSRYPLLTSHEELRLAQRIERGDLMAKDRLIMHNPRLVVSIAKRYQASSSMSLLDLVQEASARSAPPRSTTGVAATGSRPTPRSGSDSRSAARWPTRRA